MNGPATIAVTGLGTWLAQRLVERLRDRDPLQPIVGLDLRRPYRLEERLRFHRLDLTEPTAGTRLAEVLSAERVEVLVHAAFRQFPTSDVEYDHELETIGSLHVMNACAAAKVRRLVVASSTMLYGPWPDNPNFLSEDHALRGHPDAHSVQDRVEMESLLADWQRKHPDTEVSVLRHCWVMGPSYLDRVVRYFERPTVPMLLGYDPLLQFVHEEDLLDVFERATLESHPGVYNVVGTGVLPLSTVLAIAGKRAVPMPTALLYRLAYYPEQAETGDPPSGFYDYLRYLWVADGERGWATFGEPAYSSREAWMSFVTSRRLRRYR